MLCCSAMRVCGYGFIDELEQRLNLPVITSTQALLYHCLRESGPITVDEIRAVRGYGQLFSAAG